MENNANVLDCLRCGTVIYKKEPYEIYKNFVKCYVYKCENCDKEKHIINEQNILLFREKYAKRLDELEVKLSDVMYRTPRRY